MTQREEKLQEAREIIEAVAGPYSSTSWHIEMVLLALTQVRPEDAWSAAQRPSLTLRYSSRNGSVASISAFTAEHFGQTWDREALRDDIDFFRNRRLVEKNIDDPVRKQKSQLTNYTITSSFLELVRTYGTAAWESALIRFVESAEHLGRFREKRGARHVFTFDIDGTAYPVQMEAHAELLMNAVDAIQEVLYKGSRIAYFDLTRPPYIADSLLEELQIRLDPLGKLPDAILVDPRKERVILVESVHTSGQFTEFRRNEFERSLAECPWRRVYVSAFSTFEQLRDALKQKDPALRIAWNSDVWIDEEPDHLIHFNGPEYR